MLVNSSYIPQNLPIGRQGIIRYKQIPTCNNIPYLLDITGYIHLVSDNINYVDLTYHMVI